MRGHSQPIVRVPRLAYLAGAVLIAIAVLVGLAHRPSNADRVVDLTGFVRDMNTDIESCAGGVSESLSALDEISKATETDVPTAVNIATYGANNCSLASNMQLDDLTQYEVTESLHSFRLDRVVDNLITWATPDAQDVQTDVALVLRSSPGAPRARAMATLNGAIRTLDAERATVDSVIKSTDGALSAHVAAPSLPG